MSSAILLLVVLVKSVLGTFPPVSNPPPIPGQAFRSLDIPPQQQQQQPQYYIQEDFNPEPPQPSVRDGPYLPDRQDDQRWYIRQESPSPESTENPGSAEDFDRFYPNGEIAIGPVATPLPDDAYVAQPSSISNVNPGDSTKTGASDIWIMTRGNDRQYIPARLFSVSSGRVIEVVNQDLNAPEAADTVKSISNPVLDVSGKSQYVATPDNFGQQVFIRAPNVISSKSTLPNAVSVVKDFSPVNQVIDIPQQNFKQIVNQQITKDRLPIITQPQINPPPVAVVSKKEFTLPPPPPPPVKGEATRPIIVSSISGLTPESNVLISGKNGLLQQVRHIWVPTSSRTGRFVTVPVASVNSGKSLTNKGLPVDPTALSVSDTWVLKQDGPLPSFEQQKSLISPPVAQGGKVVIQDASVTQLDGPQVAQIISKSDYPQNPPIVGKSINTPLDIWPVRSDFRKSNDLGKSVTVFEQDGPVPPPKPGTVISKSAFLPPPPPPVISQKSAISSKSPQLLAPQVAVVNGKPCPLPPQQKSLFPPKNPGLLPVPLANILASQNKQPLTRIIRVNRYPSGSYYLLNSRFRPNIFTYPSRLIQQPKTNLVRLIQTKQIPFPVQSKQPFLPGVQAKAISIPVQTKASLTPTRIVAYSLPTKQIISPVVSQKSPVQSLYPVLQAVRYAYPWNGYLKSSPIPGKQVIIPQLSSFKVAPPVRSSDSIDRSAEDSSSEEKTPKRKTKSKAKTKSKEEAKSKDDVKSKEESNSKEELKSKEEAASKAEASGESEEMVKETEGEVKSVELERESESTENESKSKESIEVAESFASPSVQENSETLISNPVYEMDTSADESNVNPDLKEPFVSSSENETRNS